MPDRLEGLLHDAAAIDRFIDFICRFCSEHEISQAYSDPSRAFFTYVLKLGSRTREFLQKTVDKAASRPAWVIEKDRQKLVAIKDFWGELHSFVKPAADGDT